MANQMRGDETWLYLLTLDDPAETGVNDVDAQDSRPMEHHEYAVDRQQELYQYDCHSDRYHVLH